MKNDGHIWGEFTKPHMWKIAVLFILTYLPLKAQRLLPKTSSEIVIQGAADLATYKASPPPIYPGSILKDPSAETNRQVTQEVEAYLNRNSKRHKKAEGVLNDAFSTVNKNQISYKLKGRDIPGRELFYTALTGLKDMLEGKQPLNLKKAVFLSEQAFDPELSWEGFDQAIHDMVTHLGHYMESNSHDKNDNLAKNLAIFNFFTDTLIVNHPSKERPVVSYPLLYDFQDFWGHEDPSKVFVSKLISQGTGQCHSLPLLYLILAEGMGAEASLAFSPNHSYIKVKDKLGDWHNIELTTGSFISDQFIMQTGFVKSAAILNKTYMAPLAKKEVIAQCINDLMLNYIRKFGYDGFIARGVSTVYDLRLHSISTHLINHNYYQALFQHILRQYALKGLTRQELSTDSYAMYVYRQIIGARKHIDKLGYADMPAEMYEKWLRSVEEESQKQVHRTKMRALMGHIGNN